MLAQGAVMLIVGTISLGVNSNWFLSASRRKFHIPAIITTTYNRLF
jgi:hypothetical protein